MTSPPNTIRNEDEVGSKSVAQSLIRRRADLRTFANRLCAASARTREARLDNLNAWQGHRRWGGVAGVAAAAKSFGCTFGTWPSLPVGAYDVVHFRSGLTTPPIGRP